LNKDGILIGIDAGTSVIKSVAFTTSGEQIAISTIPNSYSTVEGGGIEQDMKRTWTDTAKTLKQLTEKIPNLARRLIAISVTGQGDGTWLVDKSGEPVAPAWLWLDARAASIAEDYVKHPNYSAHYNRTGTGVNACQMNVQLAWLAKHRPEVLSRATSTFHCKDWLYFKLTGKRAADPSEANFTFGDYRSKTYAPEILDELGASQAKQLLPPIVEGTEHADSLCADAATLTGLRAGTPITLGYVDVICTGLGGGLFDPQGKTGCTIIGSTGMHMRIAPTAADVKLNAERTGYTMCFPVPGMYAQIQSNMASTLNIDWLLDLARGILEEQGVQRSRANMLEGMDEKILAKAASRILYHPYISAAGERGPFMEPAARAMMSGLEIGHDFSDLMRSVFEGISYAARDCYAAMRDIPKEIRVTGGAARSNALRIILASTLKANVRSVSREEAGAAGAAMMAAIQQKLYPDMASCAAQWVNTLLGSNTAPDAALAKIYDQTFPLYRHTREKMQPIWRAMANIRQEVQDAP
jgi:erythritol kinase (D-erythritol 1-phosphate-forming)